MKLKTLIATALLGAVVSAPALAHDYVAKMNAGATSSMLSWPQKHAMGVYGRCGTHRCALIKSYKILLTPGCSRRILHAANLTHGATGAKEYK